MSRASFRLTKLQEARIKLVRTLQPYLADGYWAMQFVPKPGLGTTSCDKFWRVYYDPELIERLSTDEVCAYLYHELCHLIRKHHARCDAMVGHHKKFNVAGDLEINDVPPAGMSLPSNWLFPKNFEDAQGNTFPDGKLAEEYYHMLPDVESSGGGQSGGDGRLQPGECGGCAGNPQGHEDAPPSQGGSPGMEPAEAELVIRIVAEKVKEHADKRRGTVPGGLLRWANTILRPRIDPAKVLSAAVRASIAHIAGCHDYTYSKMSRRQDCSDAVLPSMRRPVPQTAVVIDTSGSMGDAELGLALGTAKRVLASAGLSTGVHVLATDACVHGAKKVFTLSDIKKFLAGGGGTDMGAGITAAMACRPRPEIILVLTDGYTPWPDAAPKGARVIIGLVADGATQYPTPTWAKTIKLYDEGK